MLSSWRVASLIGRGGSGEVYRVSRATGADGGTGNAVALKILWREDEPSRKRFAAELKLLAENQTPFLPRLIDSGEWKGRPFVVTELLEPVDLPSTDSSVAAYLLSVCKAVASLHRISIVHRDLKPKNIMRRANGEVVLIDFGLAKDTLTAPVRGRMFPLCPAS